MGVLLTAEDLTKEYPGKKGGLFTAVDHISFCIQEGEMLGLVGESGSGKTTTALMIACLVDASSGTIRLGDEDITHVAERRKRILWQDIQMIFQTPVGSFDPRHTLGDGISEGLRSRGSSKKEACAQAKRMLRLCGLDDSFYDRYPHQVSGGQCQRAAIARAIALQPKLLICDEATSALDVTVQKGIVQLLCALQEQLHMSCLFICHDLALVQQVCTRVLVMHGGRIVEEGQVDEVISHPRDQYTRTLIDSVL